MTLERERWRQVILGFASIFVIAIAEGAYLIMIVSYLERSRVPVNQIGAIMAFLSVLEAITTLGAGFVLRRWPLLVTLTVPLLAQAASAAILIFQPLGWAVWASAGLNGLGMGSSGWRCIRRHSIGGRGAAPGHDDRLVHRVYRRR